MHIGLPSICAILLSLLTCADCQADDFPPPPQPIGPPPGPANDALPTPPSSPDGVVRPAAFVDVPFAKVFKDELLKNLPRDVVVQKNHDWGHQAHIPSIRGVRLIEVMRNHGNWEKMKLICPDVPHRLHLVVENLGLVDQDRLAFTVRVAVPADVEFEKQIWQNGLQIFVGHCRGRVRLRTDFVLETPVKFDGGKLKQEANCFTLGRSKIVCYDFVPEHVNGVGGDLALLTGGTFQRAFQQYQASFEQDIVNRLRTAVERSGESIEVAAGWSKLLAAISVQNAAPTAMNTLAPVEAAASEVVVGPSPARPCPMLMVPASSVASSVAIDLLLNGQRAWSVPAHMDGHSAPASHSGSSSFSLSIGHSSPEHSGSGHSSSGHSDHHADHKK